MGPIHRKFCLGGYGKVYRAMVNLTPVAIKVLDCQGLQGMREFHNEVRMLAAIRHPHVVKLLGYAAEGQLQCLVYELMAQGNLEEVLAGSKVREDEHGSEGCSSITTC